MDILKILLCLSVTCPAMAKLGNGERRRRGGTSEEAEDSVTSTVDDSVASLRLKYPRLFKIDDGETRRKLQKILRPLQQKKKEEGRRRGTNNNIDKDDEEENDVDDPPYEFDLGDNVKVPVHVPKLYPVSKRSPMSCYISSSSSGIK